MGLDNPLHIAFLLLILLLVFGARRLPEIGRSLGEGMRGFKESITGQGSSQSTLDAASQEQVPAQPAQQPAQPAQQPAQPQQPVAQPTGQPAPPPQAG